MFRRKKVKPELDEFIARRYDDLGVRIHYDMKNGREHHNYYVPWLETMYQRYHVREKHSLSKNSTGTPLLVRPTRRAWGEEQPVTPSSKNFDANSLDPNLLEAQLVASIEGKLGDTLGLTFEPAVASAANTTTTTTTRKSDFQTSIEVCEEPLNESLQASRNTCISKGIDQRDLVTINTKSKLCTIL